MPVNPLKDHLCLGMAFPLLSAKRVKFGRKKMITNSKNVYNNMNYHWVGGYGEDNDNGDVKSDGNDRC